MKKKDVGSLKKYDLHVHTGHKSCRKDLLKRILFEAKKKKLDGIAITDYDKIKEAVKLKKLNYSLNKKQNADFEVIIGEEILTPYGIVLGFNLNKKISSGRFHDVLDEIKSQGGFASIAHPFDSTRIPYSLKKFSTHIETFNARSFIYHNRKAKHTAIHQKIAQTGGSDSHHVSEIGSGYTLFSGDLTKALKNKKTMTSGIAVNFVNSRLRSLYNKLKGNISLDKEFYSNELAKLEKRLSKKR
ncbi:MAG: PHP domain-containing protein [Candidatus Woesearchaeota archaeon]